MLEWPKFEIEIEGYNPLIITLENNSLEKKNLLDSRKITLFDQAMALTFSKI